ncbi:hypothetical protein Tco_0531922 [Tanacetum coccineum]
MGSLQIDVDDGISNLVDLHICLKSDHLGFRCSKNRDKSFMSSDFCLKSDHLGFRCSKNRDKSFMSSDLLTISLFDYLSFEVLVPIVYVGKRSLTFLIGAFSLLHSLEFDDDIVTLELEYEYVAMRLTLLDSSGRGGGSDRGNEQYGGKFCFRVSRPRFNLGSVTFCVQLVSCLTGTVHFVVTVTVHIPVTVHITVTVHIRVELVEADLEEIERWGRRSVWVTQFVPSTVFLLQEVQENEVFQDLQLIQKLRDDQKCMKKVVPSSRSMATEDIISIGSFVEVLVLNHYVPVRKILGKLSMLQDEEAQNKTNIQEPRMPW